MKPEDETQEGAKRQGTLAETADLTAEQPLYLQIYRVIAEQIASGALAHGDRLPPERDLCRRFDVGRASVRRALAELQANGLVESFAGRGTFVSEGTVSESNVLEGLTALGATWGLKITSRVLSAELCPATMEEAETFRVAPGSPIFHLERVRLLDGYEFALADTRVPGMLVEGISSIDFSTASLYEVLEVAGAGPVTAQYTVWAAAADEKTASLLAIRPGEPVLMSSTSANDGHRLVETSVVVYRADRYRMRTTMSKRKPHNRPLMSGEL
jgi:DNA-binding GntR family transcriptional regulator